MMLLFLINQCFAHLLPLLYLLLSYMLFTRANDLQANEQNTDFEEMQQKNQQLNHCRFLFQSPSVSSDAALGNERGAHVFVSLAGRFASPSVNSHNDHRQLMLQPSRVCEFAFIASADEKVDITFTEFDFPGHPPQCKRAYLDIVFLSDVAEFRNFVELNHENRYCGKDLINVPHRLISLHQSVFMLMDTTAMKNNTDGFRGFRGTFAFIPARPYHIGTPLPPSASGSNLAAASMQCGGQLIRSSMTPSGVILSPNYPGLYGDDTYCFWRLVGQPGERIRLSFNDFGLFYGDEQCPFDFVNIYDGYNAWSPLLRTLCGQLRDGDVVLFSRSNEMFIEFVSGRGRYDSRTYAGLPYWMPKDDYSNKRRGFKVSFEFSTKIVPLTSVLGAHAAHIAGTECNQLVQNTFGRSSSAGKVIDQGIPSGNNNNDQSTSAMSPNAIHSPYYPLDSPENISCTYHFVGRNERDYIDKIRLYIIDFGESTGEAILNDNVIVNPQNCNEDKPSVENAANVTASFVVSFSSAGLSSLSGVRMPDRSACSSNKKRRGHRTLTPGTIFESLGPNLTVTFTSFSNGLISAGDNRKRRFLMHYSFIRDFHVAGVGKQLADYSCHYVFNSSNFAITAPLQLPVDANSAEQHLIQQQNQFISFFTSPHFPRPYPTGLRCVYDFIIDRQKYNQLRIWFELFDVGEGVGLQQTDRLRKCRDQDHVSISQLLPAPRIQESGGSNNGRNGQTFGSYSSTSFSPLSATVLHSVLCGRYLPGPIVSDPESAGFQIVFSSVSKRSSPSLQTPFADFRGFRANFEFLVTNSNTRSETLKNGNDSSSNVVIDCPLKQIVVGRKGAIVSPNYPNSFYPAHGLSCDWTIQAYSDNARLQLMLTEFEVEGAYNPITSLENCQNAALELYTSSNLDQPTVIRCSSASVLTGEIFLSQGNRARVRFLTSPASSGGPGFRVDWNEIFDINETECRTSVTKLWCASAGRCISADLKCDGIPHCGLLDLSDEENCSRPPTSRASLVLIAAGGSAALLSLVVILLVVICRLRRQNVRHHQLEKEVISHVVSENTPDRQRHRSREGSDVSSYSAKNNHTMLSSANKKTGVLFDKTAHVTRQANFSKQQYHKALEETILIDAETASGCTGSGSVKKMQLFEKITIV